jgi:transcriptional regulator with XRE-family HTH domain
VLFDNVRALCNERNIAISKLEDDLGFPRSYICKWNKNEPGIRKVQKVAEYLGVGIEELLEEKGE